MLKAARAESQPPQLEKVIEAFVLPALSMGHTRAGGASFSRLRAVLAAENSRLLDQLVAENFDSSSAAFIDAFCECVPEIPRDEVLWRFHFMLGTIYYTATGPTPQQGPLGGAVRPSGRFPKPETPYSLPDSRFRASAGQSQRQTQTPTAGSGKKSRAARHRPLAIPATSWKAFGSLASITLYR